ncbi:MAG: M48 family metalloprotease [Clostridiales bacterium]|nr:M48 family metalloprotease [Clostridiales bacterium]MDU3240457.1 M48 family metalloprotease [Clostridiales bacterium]
MKKVIAYFKHIDFKKELKQISRYLYKDLLKPLLSTLTIFKHKPRLFIFLFVSFICFQALPFGFIKNIIIFVCVIVFLLSPAAETLLRKFYDVRHVATSKEKARLNPIFDEVYKRVRENNRFMSDNIELFLIDTTKIESFALCKNTIELSRGALETFDDQQLKAILAHEFAHLIKGDAQVKSLIYFGTSIFTTGAVIAYKVIEWIYSTLGDGFISSILKLLNLAIYGFLTITVKLLCFVVAGSDRKLEYKADAYTQQLGYGKAMVDGLYITLTLEILDKKKFSKRVMESHPRTAYRIEQLEELL